MTQNKVTHLYEPVELTEDDVWIDDQKIYRYLTNKRPATGTLTLYLDDNQTQVAFKTELLGGLKHGTTEWFHDNGVLEGSACYINGKQDWTSEHFDEEGAS